MNLSSADCLIIKLGLKTLMLRTSMHNVYFKMYEQLLTNSKNVENASTAEWIQDAIDNLYLLKLKNNNNNNPFISRNFKEPSDDSAPMKEYLSKLDFNKLTDPTTIAGLFNLFELLNKAN